MMGGGLCARLPVSAGINQKIFLMGLIGTLLAFAGMINATTVSEPKNPFLFLCRHVHRNTKARGKESRSSFIFTQLLVVVPAEMC